MWSRFSIIGSEFYFECANWSKSSDFFLNSIADLESEPGLFLSNKEVSSPVHITLLLFFRTFFHLKTWFLMRWLPFLFTSRKFLVRQRRWQKGTGESYQLFLPLVNLIPFQLKRFLSMMNLDCIQTGSGLNLNEVINQLIHKERSFLYCIFSHNYSFSVPSNFFFFSIEWFPYNY